MTSPQPTRRERLADSVRLTRIWVVDHVPLPLLTNAHEVGISVALMFVAAPLLGGRNGPESIHAQTPDTLATFWAWMLLVSGILTVWGLFATRPRVEWAGQLFMGYALTFYAMALVAFTGWNGFLASAIFGVLGLVSWWRSFKITHAALVQYRLVREARTAHELAHAARISLRHPSRKERRRG